MFDGIRIWLGPKRARRRTRSMRPGGATQTRVRRAKPSRDRSSVRRRSSEPSGARCSRTSSQPTTSVTMTPSAPWMRSPRRSRSVPRRWSGSGCFGMQGTIHTHRCSPQPNWAGMQASSANGETNEGSMGVLDVIWAHRSIPPVYVGIHRDREHPPGPVCSDGGSDRLHRSSTPWKERSG